MGLFRRKKRARTDDPTARPVLTARPDPPVVTGPEAAVGRQPAESARPLATEAFTTLIDREWTRLARPGTWWTGGERVSIAADARRAATGEPLSGILPGPVEEATRRLTVEPSTIRDIDVARWEHEGLAGFPYIELVGIVSRVLAIEVAAFGLDEKAPLLPEPEAGEPTFLRAEGAAITTGWAPTVGPATAVSSLSAVPAESEAMFDLHGALYLTLEEMTDRRIERDGLTRAQMELVAARTSALNYSYTSVLNHTTMLRSSVTVVAAELTPSPIVSGFGATGVEHSAPIIAFVDAVVLRDEEERDDARTALEAAIGKSATDRVAMVAGNFSMVNRALDAVGAPVERAYGELAAEMGLAIPHHLNRGGSSWGSR